MMGQGRDLLSRRRKSRCKLDGVFERWWSVVCVVMNRGGRMYVAPVTGFE